MFLCVYVCDVTDVRHVFGHAGDAGARGGMSMTTAAPGVWLVTVASRASEISLLYRLTDGNNIKTEGAVWRPPLRWLCVLVLGDCYFITAGAYCHDIYAFPCRTEGCIAVTMKDF